MQTKLDTTQEQLDQISLIAALSNITDIKETIRIIQIVSQQQPKEKQENAKQQAQSLLNSINKQYQAIVESQNKVDLYNPVQPKKVARLYVDGVFDLMHSGHYNALRQAKQFAETLVVGVVSHEDVCRRKGTPILTLEERVTLAKSCKFVDEIFEGCPYDASIELLDKLNCSHIAHGDDLILTADGKDSYQPFKDANRMIIFKRTEGISTTDIVGRLLLMSKQNPSSNLVKKIRKSSGDQGLQASQVKEEYDEKENTQEQPMVINKVKMLNTTRRIRQFSADHKEPKEGDKIVYIDGSYDLLHVGHIKTLQAAKAQGDYLIVGLHDDETINEVKGSNYPILQLQERVLNVLAMRDVDEVIIGAPWVITEQMIKQFNIHVVVEGTMTKQKENSIEIVQLSGIQDPYAVPKKLGIFKQIESVCDMTTETIIERIVNNRLQYLEIYNRKAKKEENYYKSDRNKEVQEN